MSRSQSRRESTELAIYGVVTADLVASRAQTDRASSQERLLKLVGSLNTQFRKAITARFMVTLGDEIQGLLHEITSLPQVVTEVHGAFHPQEITIGIGIGGIATRLMRKVTEMDGPAFVYSRDALQTAKSRQREVVVKSDRTGLDEIVNSVYVNP